MAERVTGAAARRRERQLRSMLRHEGQTVATEVSTAPHHSRDVGPSPRAATFTDACTQTAPAAEWIAPPPAAYTTPTASVHAAPAPVIEYVAPAPVPSNLFEHPIPVVQVVQVEQVQLIEKNVEFPEILLWRKLGGARQLALTLEQCVIL